MVTELDAGLDAGSQVQNAELDKEQLAEYQACHEHILRSANLVWQSVAIVAGFALGSGALLLKDLSSVLSSWAGVLVLIVLALTVTFGLFFPLKNLVKRENYRQKVHYHYLWELEERGGMLAATILDRIDNNTEGKRDETLKMLHLLEVERVRPAGWGTVDAIILIAAVPWMLMFIGAVLSVLCKLGWISRFIGVLLSALW